MIILSVGHYKKSPGAAYKSTNEFSLNYPFVLKVAKHLDELGESVAVFAFDYCPLVSKVAMYNKIHKINPVSAAIEFHLNSGNPKQNYSMVKYWGTSKKGKFLAENLIQACKVIFGKKAKLYNKTGLLPGKENYKEKWKKRGNYFLKQTAMPAIIFEPAFIEKPKALQKYFNNPKVIAKAIKDWLDNK